MAESLKPFFRERTITEIRDACVLDEIDKDLVRHILDCPPDEGRVITVPHLIPAQFGGDPKKFKKHGREVKLRRFSSIDEAMAARKLPYQLRNEAFSETPNKAYCAYSIKPIAGVDGRTRRFSLSECVKGAKLYFFGHLPQNRGEDRIRVLKPFKDSARAQTDGATVLVHVPSRTEGREPYEFLWHSVPIASARYGTIPAFGILTDHVCQQKRFKIRFKEPESKESSRVVNFCAHDVAGYLEIIDHFKNYLHNLAPLNMSQVAIPTQLTVGYYKRLGNNCLIKTQNDRRPRKLNEGEMEIMLWGLVHALGPRKTFFAEGKKLRDYDWTI